MCARITRWGNRLGLRIPRTVAQDLGLDDGALVELRLIDGDLVVRPVHWTLEDLVAGIAPDKVHGEMPWGRPAGREPW